MNVRIRWYQVCCIFQNFTSHMELATLCALVCSCHQLLHGLRTHECVADTKNDTHCVRPAIHAYGTTRGKRKAKLKAACRCVAGPLPKNVQPACADFLPSQVGTKTFSRRLIDQRGKLANMHLRRC